MSEPSIQHLLRETMERYYTAHCQWPKRMRASIGLNHKLARELTEQGMIMIEDAEYWEKHMVGGEDFQFCGVAVTCDLPTSVPTVVA